jgi:nondiscriminating aspartyl-tRNA synthetase
MSTLEIDERTPRVLSADASSYLGQLVTVKGFVHRIYDFGQLLFIHVRDRTGLLQCTLEGIQLDRHILPESVVSVYGRMTESQKAPGGIEMRVEKLDVLSEPTVPLPFEINKKGLRVKLDGILDHRVLSLREPSTHAVLSIQSALVAGFREFLQTQGFTQIFTPKIVGSGTEGGSNLFPVNYFEQSAYLAQSPQFYKQMMIGAGYERVFEIGPVFRAESHNTSRHLNEYTSLDVEIGFVENESELMQLETELLKYMFDYVAGNCRNELALHGLELPVITDIPRITLAEAQGILRTEYNKESPNGDLDPEGERLICKHMAQSVAVPLVFITQYPLESRPMYALPMDDKQELTASFDLLFNGLEITTGGLRIHRIHELEMSIKRRRLNPENFTAYLDAFRYGMPPHGGFAIGLERLTSKLLNLANVREATAFPRDRHRLTP